MPDIQVTGNTFNEKWIDGGTASVSPTFNVDKPTFWTPLPTISGLVSGFCERLAVVSAGLASSATAGDATTQLLTGFTWYQNPSTQEQIASNSAMVSKCVDNIALGNPLNSTFTAVTGGAVMHIVGNPTSNYMKGMDARITVLVSNGGFVSSAATPGPYTFSGTNLTLATAASARALVAGSAIPGTISSGGGTLLSGTMKVTLPATWAIQRKWLLDELRYTPGTLTIGQTKTPVYIGCYALAQRTYVEDKTTLTAAIKGVIDVGDQENYADYGGNALTYLNLVRTSTTAISYAASSAYLPYGATAQWEWGNVQTPVNAYVMAPMLDGMNAGVWFMPNISSSNATHMEDIKTFYSGVYTEMVQPYTAQNLHYSTYNRYLVQSGATVTFTADPATVGDYGVAIQFLDIQSGGTAYIDPGNTPTQKIHCVELCNVMNGGKLSVLSNGHIVNKRTATSIYINPEAGCPVYYFRNYIPLNGYIDGGWCAGHYVYESGNTITTLPKSGTDTYGLYVLGGDNGANTVTLNFSGTMLVAQVESGCTAIVNNSNADLQDVSVQSGGSLYISKGSAGFVHIGNGAAVTVKDSCSQINVYSGGTVTINGASAHVDTLWVQDGAKVNITASSLQAGTLYNSDSVLINNVHLTLFHPFQFTTLTEGWNTFQVTSETTSRGRYLGSSANTTIATISNSIINAVTANPLKDINDYTNTAFGQSTIGGVAHNGYSIFGQLSSCTVTYGNQVMAFYPATDGGSAEPINHYTEFKCRQSETDPPTAPTT